MVGRRRPVVVLMLQRRQVGQRHFRPRGRSRHRFQLYAKAVVRVVRIGPRRVVVNVRGFRFLAGERGAGNAAAAAERPQLGQDEPPGVPALLEHRVVVARTELADVQCSTAVTERVRGNSAVSVPVSGTRTKKGIDSGRHATAIIILS